MDRGSINKMTRDKLQKRKYSHKFYCTHKALSYSDRLALIEQKYNNVGDMG